MTYAERMADIEQRDAKRRAKRDAAELAKLTGTDTPGMYYASRGITGEPSEKNRQYKASDDSWKRGLKGRTFGVARRGAAGHTVKVTRNGRTTIEDARGFGRTEKSVKRNQAVTRHVSARQAFYKEWREKQ
jgi:hypothetical protein